ncbi:uncharacterized protein LOC122871611, partial [Siniperca chuatsi]|uniref:uncharacterized protein LOC122871611 n=1 Tax=Siniperca chuatsi TaxID=119488 RepID=UPI001CE09A81
MTDPQQMQPVAMLAQMLGEIVAMHQEQAAVNRQQLERMQDQADKQTQLLASLVSQPGASLPPSPPLALSGITLHKMSAADDPQSFLEMFEATAVACGWPATEWSVRLLPLLSGEAQTAALGLPAAARRSFPDVRRAVLDRLGFSSEDHRRRFRSMRLGPADRPFVYAQQLRDAATRWLQPGESSEEGRLMDAIIGEQFAEGLPAGVAEWVKC